MNKQDLLNLTMVASFAGSQNVKMVLFDVVTSCYDCYGDLCKVMRY